MIAKPVTEAGDQAPERPAAPAADDEAYHTYLGEDAPKAAPAEAPPAPVAPPPPPVVRNLVLRPDAVRVRPGERAEIEATLEGGPMPAARWELAGGASAFATVSPTVDGALIELHPGPGEPPWSSSLEVRCLVSGARMAVASAAVEILADEATPPPRPAAPTQPAPPASATPPPPTTGQTPWRTPLLLVALGGCLLAIAALCLDPLKYLANSNGHTISLLDATNGNLDTTLYSKNTFNPLIIIAGVALVLVVLSLVSQSRVLAIGAALAGLGFIGYSIRVHSLSPGSVYGYSTGFTLSIVGAAVVALAAGAASFARSR